MVNAVLEQLDDSLARDGVIVIGACKIPDNLDPALTRSGRLEKIIDVPFPNGRGRPRIAMPSGGIRRSIGFDYTLIQLSNNQEPPHDPTFLEPEKLAVIVDDVLTRLTRLIASYTFGNYMRRFPAH